ncbi:MAG: helix-hairpin-helix domain-containing protein [Deltaproteobacteria bacterium]|nr:helix-hairpin-helix domain-containing protein [Deltaproteobacteria bacterium]
MLALLPGLGPVRAQALVDARPLCSLAEVDRVAGIGPVTLRTLAGQLAFPDLPRGCEHELRVQSH